MDVDVDGDVDELIRACGLITFLWIGLRRRTHCVHKCQREHLPQPKCDVTKAAKKCGTDPKDAHKVTRYEWAS